MPSTVVTSLLWPAGDNISIKGEVFEAEATGTVYFLRGCKPSDPACEYQTAFLELGPWASETLPAGAAETGVYSVDGTVDHTVYTSVCDMSRSVIEKCTVSKQSEFGDSTEYTITRTKGETGDEFTLLYHAVTLTGGVEKLASASTAVASTKASSTDETSSTGDASSVTDASSGSATDSSSTQTEMETASSETTSTTETPIPTETASAGSPPLVRAFAALAVAGMAAALVV
ncbi:hypothetical protein CEP52_013966 [Fusarium oligoseptatum]|uniref:Uncharacterized protein n=1 Tax=Fusarium oligoseptatum TaxID=2604345 RepID=A0A428SQZ3_9HYPO|nr:hypothetical protein CEP52_013966 [Fusarium oligoseptatum]